MALQAMRPMGGLLLTVLVLAAAPANAAAPTHKVLDLRLTNGRPVVSGVFVNGAGPFRFLIDTGSQLNSISEEIAERLQWKPAFAVELVSMHGTARRGAFIASHVSLGSMKTQAQRFVLAPEDEMERVARGVDGVLGQAFLNSVDYRLDIERKQLTLGAAEERGLRIPFERSNGRMLVATNQGRLVLDSGSDTVVLRKTMAGEYGRLHAATGSVAVRTGLIDLEVHGFLKRSVTAAFVPGAKADAETPDGLLPLSLLGSIYVSNSGGYVVIESK